MSRATNWDELVTKMSLSQLSRHRLWHTGATWMADVGIPLHVLQKILGHKSIETTKGYLHLNLGHIAKAGEMANRFLDAQTDDLDQAPTRKPNDPDQGSAARGL